MSLDGLVKTSNEKSWSPDRDLNREPPECKEKLLIRIYSVIINEIYKLPLRKSQVISCVFSVKRYHS